MVPFGLFLVQFPCSKKSSRGEDKLNFRMLPLASVLEEQNSHEWIDEQQKSKASSKKKCKEDSPDVHPPLAQSSGISAACLPKGSSQHLKGN